MMNSWTEECRPESIAVSNTADEKRPIAQFDEESAKSPVCYGSTDKLNSTGDKLLKAFGIAQQVLAFVLGVFVLTMIGARFFAVAPHPALHSATVPKASTVPAPKCTHFQYPHCEKAINFYIAQGSRSRCEAFERVKAEGDVFRYPYDPNSHDFCNNTTGRACCGCAAQCSRCPPMLPGCSSWALDGRWVVAFDDGNEAKFTFDAHGHFEAHYPVAFLPKTWKDHMGAYIKEGYDLLAPARLNVSLAKTTCAATPGCLGITFDGVSYDAQSLTYLVYFKSVNAITPAASTKWETHILDQAPTGPFVAVSGGLHPEKNHTNKYTIDLNDAAPHLFPFGAFESITLTDDEIKVIHLGGMDGVHLSGTGIVAPRT